MPGLSTGGTSHVEQHRDPRLRLPHLPNGFVERYGLAYYLRKGLEKAGVVRQQLFEQTDTRLALRAHELRASDVTVNLASGKSEEWITDRTGHKSSQMICRYKRQGRTHAELNLGGFKPLHEAIPELALATHFITDDGAGTTGSLGVTGKGGVLRCANDEGRSWTSRTRSGGSR
jgi:hypothetical protein